MTDDALLRRWAADTWRSFGAMTDEHTGLPTDHIGVELDPDGPVWLHVADWTSQSSTTPTPALTAREGA